VRRYTPATWLWIGLVTLAAVSVTVRAFQESRVTSTDWLVLGLLAVCAAAAHHFPIRSADGSATFAITNVLLIAGAIILPPGLVGLLPVLALSPQSWLRRHAAGELARWVFNTAQATLAVLAAATLVEWAQGRSPHDPRSLAVGLGAGATFIVVQATLVGIVIALNSGIPLARAATFARPALLGEATKAILAVVVAGLWLADPPLVLVLPLLLLLAHQNTRTAHLAHMAEVDPKTGIHNARHFEHVLEEELAHSRRLKRPLAVLFADLDHFKRVNDRHGHDVGDRVLRSLALLLGEQLRKGDVVARFGGEEFVALLPGTDAEQAMYLAERLRATVADHPFELPGGSTLHCTISIGVAVCPEDGTDAAILLQRADAGMYRAKQTRNAVSRAEDLAPLPARRVADHQPARPATDAAPRLTRALLWAISVAGLLAGAWGLLALTQRSAWEALPPLIALAVLIELLPVPIHVTRYQSLSFSMSTAVILAAVTTEPSVAWLVGLVSALAHAAVGRQWAPLKILCGVGTVVAASNLAGWVYGLIRPRQPGYGPEHLGAEFVPVLVYVMATAGIAVLMVSVSSRQPLRTILRESAAVLPMNVLLGLSGAFLGAICGQLGPFGAAVLAVPVLLMHTTLALYAKRSRAVIRALEHRAQHDSQTDLANDAVLQERLQAALDTSGGSLALLLLDVQRFQDISDTFGQHVRDQLLRQVGQRLRTAVRETDTIARLGGSEFAVMLPTAGSEAAERVASLLRRTLAEPFVLESHALEVSASIGIAVGHPGEATTLLRQAGVALVLAKQGPGAQVMYHPEQDQQHPEELSVITELRRAIERDQLLVHYQPQVSMADDRLVGAEMLVRWRHPQRGLLAPDQLSALAERTGLTRPLTRWVLEAALAQAQAWRAAGLEVPVAVKVPTRALFDPSLPEVLSERLAALALPPDCLRLEVTDNLLTDPEAVIEVLGRLRAVGLRVSVADFGRGRLSLAHLKRLPADELKIDRTFARHLSSNPADAAIVEWTITLGHKLGLVVVADGVDDPATWEVLARSGCDVAQGYQISRSLPAPDFARWAAPYLELPPFGANAA
jgi:diguanylate cyclase (GGDEF)-like protein